MEYILQKKSLAAYLEPDEYIDSTDPRVAYVASYIAETMMETTAAMKKPDLLHDPEMHLARAMFYFVRDRISHTIDIGASEVTRKASEVLVKKHGFCYAKSHLLAALLRAGGIPAGVCYQYLRFSDEDDRLVIHGLNAVYFASIGRWVRLDARGNTGEINAEFSIDEERLAFPVRPGRGETDLPILYASPDRAIIRALNSTDDAKILQANLPGKIYGK